MIETGPITKDRELADVLGGAGQVTYLRVQAGASRHDLRVSRAEAQKWVRAVWKSGKGWRVYAWYQPFGRSVTLYAK